MIKIYYQGENGVVASEVKQFTFPGGEVQVKIDPTVDLIQNELSVEAIIKNSDDLMALLLTKEALDFRTNSVTKKYLTLAYFPYARQDRRCSAGESDAARNVIIPMIDNLGFDGIRIVDIHNEKLLKLFKTPIDYVSQSQITQRFVNSGVYDNAVLPDEGAYKKASYDLTPEKTVVYQKDRNLDTGEITGVSPVNESSFIEKLIAHKDKTMNLIVLDDICDGGRTFIEVAKDIRRYAKLYNVKLRLDLYVTHGIFSKGVDIILELYDNVYTTSSLGDQDERVKIVDLKLKGL